MISCIICSRYPDISNELKHNIASTIGCEYELVVIDNSKNEYTIFSAYNEGARRSNGDVLCFMHEDIFFRSNDWGLVTKYLNGEHYGLIGVIGGLYYPNYPCAWWHSATETGQIIQGIYDDDGNYSIFKQYLWNRKHGDIIEAVTVDGLWMCIKKSLFDDGIIKFDDTMFRCFHLYDADICMQIINAGYEVGIVFDVFIEHKSGGTFKPEYFDALDIWYDKWKKLLPLKRSIEMSKEEQFERDDLCKRYSDLQRNHAFLSDRIYRIEHSYPYRIGQFLLKPLKFLKKQFYL